MVDMVGTITASVGVAYFTIGASAMEVRPRSKKRNFCVLAQLRQQSMLSIIRNNAAGYVYGVNNSPLDDRFL
jgi:hypothetical protein